MEPLSICLGIVIGAVPVILLWSRSADRAAIERARREDADYMRGWHRGMAGKKPQLHIYEQP